MIIEKNLEIFKENKLIEKLVEYFSYKEKENNIFHDFISEIKKEPQNDFSKKLNELFQFELKNEFGEGDNLLTRYGIISKEDPEKVIYLNIAKSSHKNNENKINSLDINTETNFLMYGESNVIYEIDFFTSNNNLENSHFKYFDKLTDYDRLLNPEYYVEKQDHIDLNNNFEDAEDVIDLNPNQEYQSIYKNNIHYVLNKLNEKFQDDEKIYFNQSETSFSKSKIADLIEVLEVDYMRPDGLAETTDNLKDDTYIYLWNNLVKFNEMLEDSGLNYKMNKDELSVGDLWDFIPENHQKNIITGLSEVKDLKLKNGIFLSEITPRDLFGDIQEDKKIFMVHPKDPNEGHLTKVFKDKEECDKYFKTHSYNKRNERLPF